MCGLVQGCQPWLAQVLQGVNLMSSQCNVSAERATAGSTNESTSVSVDTHKHCCERTVKARCPERTQNTHRASVHAYTHNLNAFPPALPPLINYIRCCLLIPSEREKEHCTMALQWAVGDDSCTKRQIKNMPDFPIYFFSGSLQNKLVIKTFN